MILAVTQSELAQHVIPIASLKFPIAHSPPLCGFDDGAVLKERVLFLPQQGCERAIVQLNVADDVRFGSCS
jgi:hypothetical protein